MVVHSGSEHNAGQRMQFSRIKSAKWSRGCACNQKFAFRISENVAMCMIYNGVEQKLVGDRPRMGTPSLATKFCSTPLQIMHIATFWLIPISNFPLQMQPLDYFGLSILENCIRCSAWCPLPHCTLLQCGCSKMWNCLHFQSPLENIFLIVNLHMTFPTGVHGPGAVHGPETSTGLELSLV